MSNECLAVRVGLGLYATHCKWRVQCILYGMSNQVSNLFYDGVSSCIGCFWFSLFSAFPARTKTYHPYRRESSSVITHCCISCKIYKFLWQVSLKSIHYGKRKRVTPNRCQRTMHGHRTDNGRPAGQTTRKRDASAACCWRRHIDIGLIMFY